MIPSLCRQITLLLVPSGLNHRRCRTHHANKRYKKANSSTAIAGDDNFMSATPLLAERFQINIGTVAEGDDADPTH